MGPITNVLLNIPTWISPIIVLVIIGGVAGMFTMMKTTNSRIKNIENVCKGRLEHCGDIFQRVSEVRVRHDVINGRLKRIEDKLDAVILKNGWGK